MCYGGCNCKRCMGEDDKMESKKWVQHISGQGEKWGVLGEYPYGWKVPVPPGKGQGGETWFPKSEYTICDPPEEWKDVTSQVYTYESVLGLMKTLNHRLRRVRCAKATGFDNPDWAFIAERKRS